MFGRTWLLQLWTPTPFGLPHLASIRDRQADFIVLGLYLRLAYLRRGPMASMAHDSQRDNWPRQNCLGRIAAGRAVALLPSVMDEATPEPERCERGEILREIQTIAKTIFAKN